MFQYGVIVIAGSSTVFVLKHLHKDWNHTADIHKRMLGCDIVCHMSLLQYEKCANDKLVYTERHGTMWRRNIRLCLEAAFVCFVTLRSA